MFETLGKFHPPDQNKRKVFVLSKKPLFPGVSGDREHDCVMSGVIKHIKHTKKTLHITFFDLVNAFGSVPHDETMHSLKQNNIPQQMKNTSTTFIQTSHQKSPLRLSTQTDSALSR